MSLLLSPLFPPSLPHPQCLHVHSLCVHLYSCQWVKGSQQTLNKSLPFKTSSVGTYLLDLYSHNSKKYKSCAHSTSGIAKRQTPNLTHPAKVKVAVFWKICMHPNIWVGLLSFDFFGLTRVMDRLSYITVGEKKKNKGKMIFCFLYHNPKILMHFTFIHGRERRGSSTSSLELLLPPDEVMEGRAICFSEQVTLPLGKKRKKPQHCICT